MELLEIDRVGRMGEKLKVVGYGLLGMMVFLRRRGSGAINLITINLINLIIAPVKY